MGLSEDGLSPENGLSVTWEKDDKSIGIGDAIFSDTSIWSISIFYTTMYFGNTIYIGS
jgi:hypothetical protein